MQDFITSLVATASEVDTLRAQVAHQQALKDQSAELESTKKEVERLKAELAKAKSDHDHYNQGI